MKESYREGVASHPGPQTCEGGREAALEALERGIRRQAIELRNPLISGAGRVRAGRLLISPRYLLKYSDERKN